MQKNLDIEENGNGTHSLTCDTLMQLLLGFEGVRLTRIYPRATVLFAEGEPADGVYILRSGRVKISISSAIGKKVVLAIPQAGALLGVSSVLHDLPHGVAVETIERCRIDFVSRSDFLKLLDKSEVVRIGVAYALSNELNGFVEHMRSLLLAQSASEKLAGLLLKWCDEQRTLGSKEVRLNLRLTHEEIGQIICVSRETVTRLFAELRKRQIVSFADNAIVIRELNALESLARPGETLGISLRL